MAIYLLEDDEAIQKLVTYTLGCAGFSVSAFSHPRLFWSALEHQLPQLVLLDIMLPEQDGLSVLQSLRSNPKSRRLPVILLSALASEYDKVNGLDHGADDYLSKPFGTAELLSRVKALLRRPQSGAAPQYYAVGPLTADLSGRRVLVEGREVPLSRKEYDILAQLLSARGLVVRRDQLIQEIWGGCFDGESRTIDVHIRHLRQKLGPAGSLIATIKGVGYQISGDCSAAETKKLSS